MNTAPIHAYKHPIESSKSILQASLDPSISSPFHALSHCVPSPSSSSSAPPMIVPPHLPITAPTHPLLESHHLCPLLSTEDMQSTTHVTTAAALAAEKCLSPLSTCCKTNLLHQNKNQNLSPSTSRLFSPHSHNLTQPIQQREDDDMEPVVVRSVEYEAGDPEDVSTSESAASTELVTSSGCNSDTEDEDGNEDVASHADETGLNCMEDVGGKQVGDIMDEQNDAVHGLHRQEDIFTPKLDGLIKQPSHDSISIGNVNFSMISFINLYLLLLFHVSFRLYCFFFANLPHPYISPDNALVITPTTNSNDASNPIDEKSILCPPKKRKANHDTVSCDVKDKSPLYNFLPSFLIPLFSHVPLSSFKQLESPPNTATTFIPTQSCAYLVSDDSVSPSHYSFFTSHQLPPLFKIRHDSIEFFTSSNSHNTNDENYEYQYNDNNDSSTPGLSPSSILSPDHSQDDSVSSPRFSSPSHRYRYNDDYDKNESETTIAVRTRSKAAQRYAKSNSSILSSNTVNNSNSASSSSTSSCDTQGEDNASNNNSARRSARHRSKARPGNMTLSSSSSSLNTTFSDHHPSKRRHAGHEPNQNTNKGGNSTLSNSSSTPELTL